MNKETRVQHFVLEGCDPMTLLSHMAFYGLASIIETEVLTGLRLSWTEGMAPRPRLCGPGLTEQDLAETVRRHAATRARPLSWPSERVLVAGKARGLMSPRMGKVDDWDDLQHQRHAVLDRLAKEGAWLDLRLLWSLGEPCYWRLNHKGERMQDDGSSRLEMQPRNQGSEIVANRFAPLAGFVGTRSVEAVIAGLRGEVTNDELGHGQPDSRSATGFRGPGPVDDALAWCALWGISQFPQTPSTRRATTTAGHLGSPSGGWFYVPTWRGDWSASRLRTILASSQLRAIGTQAVGEATAETTLGPSAKWLAARGVRAVVTFPVERFGSPSAPERRAQRGTLHRLGVVS